jgi:thiol-disulfide isomerase/thioredoxin
MSKSRIARIVVVALLLLSMVGFAGLSTLFAPAQEAPKAKGRKADDIVSDLRTTGQKLSEVLESPQVLMDPEQRAKVAPKAIPHMQKLVALFDELAAAEERAKPQAMGAQRQLLAMLAVMGDEDANATLVKRGEEKDGAQWKATVLLVRWWKAAKDPAEQGKVLDELAALCKANSADEQLAPVVAMFAEQAAANNELRDRVEKIFLEELKSPAATELAEGIKAAGKLRGLEGKPLVIEGQALDGSKFSTAQWKGKVILVDFWATWCGPCREELPRLKKAYADFHKEGLEVVGVSCDRKEAALKEFLKANPDMPWPQLFDSNAKGGWHPLAESYGIMGIPTMFLIDKKGVVRTVAARENYEELIPKLLQE